MHGWDSTIIEPTATFPNERTIRFERGASTIELLRYWDEPRQPGGPMVVATCRKVVVARRLADLMTTSLFEGIEQEVRVTWITGKGHDVEYGVRLMFAHCSDDVIAETLARVVVAW